MAQPTLRLDHHGLSLEGVAVSFPVRAALLAERWGQPERWVGSGGTVLTWHELGLFAHEADEEHVTTLCLQLLPEPGAPDFAPRSTFAGTFLVDGSPAAQGIAGADAVDITGLASTVLHGVQVHVTHADDAVESIELTSPAPTPPPVPREEYLLRPATGPALRFTDLNLKLAVVDELMYRQQVLGPTFSLREFVRWYDGRTIDLEREAGRPVPEVLEYFTELEIEQSLADRVRELVVDAGNEIYQQVAPWWDGEDATFDIGSWDDLALLPALERLEFVSLTPDPATLGALRERGLQVDA
ncbi:DUF6892 domain-containing protein [Desertihabitans aurantiacus]|uniref:DUF6892 domain-containing protein n=1 Tax=Desertihabitans aurantiacus TaxID=2282477 RepID=UPI000DF7987E|nr:hypothetical protein [Desertihabitans aurantiacus]